MSWALLFMSVSCMPKASFNHVWHHVFLVPFWGAGLLPWVIRLTASTPPVSGRANPPLARAFMGMHPAGRGSWPPHTLVVSLQCRAVQSSRAAACPAGSSAPLSREREPGPCCHCDPEAAASHESPHSAVAGPCTDCLMSAHTARDCPSRGRRVACRAWRGSTHPGGPLLTSRPPL